MKLSRPVFIIPREMISRDQFARSPNRSQHSSLFGAVFFLGSALCDIAESGALREKYV